MVADDVAVRFASLDRERENAPSGFHAAHTEFIGVSLVGDDAEFGVEESDFASGKCGVAFAVADVGVAVSALHDGAAVGLLGHEGQTFDGSRRVQFAGQLAVFHRDDVAAAGDDFFAVSCVTGCDAPRVRGAVSVGVLRAGFGAFQEVIPGPFALADFVFDVLDAVGVEDVFVIEHDPAGFRRIVLGSVTDSVGRAVDVPCMGPILPEELFVVDVHAVALCFVAGPVKDRAFGGVGEPV